MKKHTGLINSILGLCLVFSLTGCSFGVGVGAGVHQDKFELYHNDTNLSGTEYLSDGGNVKVSLFSNAPKKWYTGEISYSKGKFVRNGSTMDVDVISIIPKISFKTTKPKYGAEFINLGLGAVLTKIRGNGITVGSKKDRITVNLSEDYVVFPVFSYDSMAYVNLTKRTRFFGKISLKLSNLTKLDNRVKSRYSSGIFEFGIAYVFW